MERLELLKCHLQGHVILHNTSQAVVLRFNRPSVSNAASFEMIYSTITQAEVCKCQNKYLVLTGNTSKNFIAGGDLKLTTQQVSQVPEYLRSLHEMFWKVHKLGRAISLWTGHVIGSGAGLACSCAFRVGFPCTSYSMPENMLGLFPDVGAPYFLTHYLDLEVGLYLFLTGTKVLGADTYFLGLTNFYIPEHSFESILNEMQHLDPLEVIKKHHKEPSSAESGILKCKGYIKECFSAASLEGILAKLKTHNSDWHTQTLAKLEKSCPLSLKVAFEVFHKCKDLTLKEVLEAEYRWESAMMVHLNYNFQTGVKYKLSKKKNPPWLPSTLEEVTSELLDSVLNNPQPLNIDLSKLD